jgi:nucleoid-associated protein YgaU
MEKQYCPFLLKAFRTRFRTLTLSVLVSIGFVGCADDGSDVEEPIAASETGPGEGGEEGAAPEGEVVEEVVEEDMPSETTETTDAAPVGDTELTDGTGTIDPSGDAAFAEGQTTPTDDTVAGEEIASEPLEGTTEEVVEDTTPAETVTTLTQVTTPTSMASNEPVTMSGESGTYVVQPGDSLSAIARKIYGQLDRWNDLASANNIPSPYVIHPGDELKFNVQGGKSETFVSKYQQVPEKTVKVKHGDTLSSIAQAIYGDSNYWRVFVTYNKDKISNPHRISTGLVLSYRDPKALSKVLGAVYPSGDKDKPKKIAIKVDAVEEEEQEVTEETH